MFAWIGFADLRASRGDLEAGLGPIAQAVKSRQFKFINLLSDHSSAIGKAYVNWLSCQTDSTVVLKPAKLSSPTHFGEIYEHAVSAVGEFLSEQGKGLNMTFHISPGTPAMAAVWVILSKTRYPAELIESSREKGVQTASVPFDMSADYIPDLLKRPDEELVRLSRGLDAAAPEFDSIIHRCAPMKRLIVRARRVAPRNVPILILGESGTGKELIARSIHQASPRRGPLVAVNCGAIPGELVESELFGHEKGAFTGAISNKSGYIEESSGGTLFLDEIGDLPLNAQVKLLRVLQEGKVVKVGSVKPVDIDIRVIAATNKNLMREVIEGRFREDLFHRIAVAILNVPPLREREGDLSLLVDYILEQINREAANQPGYKDKKISSSARNIIIGHSWPGNVRELSNTLLRAAIWSSDQIIDEKDIKESLLEFPKNENADILGQPLGNGLDVQFLVAEVARHYLRRALKESGGNKTKAAELVGLPSYQTFTNWLQKYGVEN